MEKKLIRLAWILYSASLLADSRHHELTEKQRLENTFAKFSDRSISIMNHCKRNLSYLDLSDDKITDMVSNGARFNRVLEINSIPTKKFDKVFAIVGISAQDTGPFSPNSLFLLAYRGSKSYATSSELTLPNSPFSSCKKEWEKREATRKIGDEESDRGNFVEYCKCTGQKLQNETSVMSSIHQRINVLLDRAL